MDEPKVELLRVAGEEKLYDRESLLGRDVSSVFPSEAKKPAASGVLDPEAIKEAIGARKFISETELESIAASRGKSVEDGTIAVDKSLAEILAERKRAKEEEFATLWKQMKTGKNRPLDAEELEFFDKVLDEEAERERQVAELEAAELAEFRAALRGRVGSGALAEPSADAALLGGEGLLVGLAEEEEDKGNGAAAGGRLLGGAGASTSLPLSSTLAAVGVGNAGPRAVGPQLPVKATMKPLSVIVKPIIQPKPLLVKVKPKDSQSSAQASIAPAAGGTEVPPAKRTKVDDGSSKGVAVAAAATKPAGDAKEDEDEDGGLAGLLGGYGSDDSDS